MWAGPACVGLDTACGKGGFLTAFELPARTVYERVSWLAGPERSGPAAGFTTAGTTRGPARLARARWRRRSAS